MVRLKHFSKREKVEMMELLVQKRESWVPITELANSAGISPLTARNLFRLSTKVIINENMNPVLVKKC